MQFGQHKGQNPSPQGAQASQAFCLTSLHARLGEFRGKKPPPFRLHARQRKKACVMCCLLYESFGGHCCLLTLLALLPTRYGLEDCGVCCSGCRIYASGCATVHLCGASIMCWLGSPVREIRQPELEEQRYRKEIPRW